MSDDNDMTETMFARPVQNDPRGTVAIVHLNDRLLPVVTCPIRVRKLMVILSGRHL
jgi:hypothetical protein